MLAGFLLSAFAVSAEETSTPDGPAFADTRPRSLETAVTESPVLRIVVTDDFPPFAFVDGTGRLSGIHIELARALCQTMNRLCTVQARRSDRVIEALEDGTADIAIAGIAVNTATRARLDFTEPYFRFPARLVAVEEAAGEAGAEAEAGTVAVIAGSAHEAYLKRFRPDLVLLPLEDGAALRSALSEGRVALGFADGVDMAFFLASAEGSACCRFAGGPFFDADYFGHGLRIALAPGRSGLRVALDGALAGIAANGTLHDILQRAFPVDPFSGWEPPVLP
ncbi:MAG: transporter substrate-binding domain-containing protein [Hyphomicrobiaceae bacterium]|nr:transporter substrate-binding domain-containing protein [Hyphomicrobiaceae bacterium]